MPNIILVKRSAVQSKAPSVSDLSLGELGINTYDGKLFLKKNNGVESIVDLTANQTITVTGDVTGSGSTSITMTLAASGVSAGTYNNVTVDAKGRVTGGTNVAYLTAVPVATASVLGGVKQGVGTTIGGDGTISVAIPTNNSFSFVGLGDTADTPVADGYLRWNAGASAITYSATIPRTAVSGAAVFAAGNSSNSVFTSTTVWADQPFNIEFMTDSAFTHSTTNGSNFIITLTKAARYRLSINASGFRSTGSNVSYGVRIVSAPTSGGTYTLLQAASSYSIANAASILQSCVTASAVINGVVGQSFKVQFKLTTVGGVTVVPDSLLFQIEEI